VIPSVREWYEQYHDQGLEIIGVHTPEFQYEHHLPNVEAAVADLNVTWPVTLDNERTTWRAYQNRYWPAMYLIDKQGNIRFAKFGEGQYDVTEAVIQLLLAEES
jgi:hypothetical protein